MDVTRASRGFNYRKSMSGRKSRGLFSRTARRSHPVNMVSSNPMRLGIRM